MLQAEYQHLSTTSKGFTGRHFVHWKPSSMAILSFLMPEGKKLRWAFLRRFSVYILAWIRSRVYSAAPRQISKVIHPFDTQERFQQALKVEDIIYILSAMCFPFPLLNNAAAKRFFRHYVLSLLDCFKAMS